ncbi:hypothetical protein, partial [Klebsiella pneumoniae]|uniref:hypothetical protein n=1 Tax=Klebsiella pneumoniae TaxID=573 RepID=UPI001C7006DA
MIEYKSGAKKVLVCQSPIIGQLNSSIFFILSILVYMFSFDEIRIATLSQFITSQEKTKPPKNGIFNLLDSSSTKGF